MASLRLPAFICRIAEKAATVTATTHATHVTNISKNAIFAL
jgi:hypothetical protein